MEPTKLSEMQKPEVAMAKPNGEAKALQPTSPHGVLTKEALKESAEQRALLAEYVKGQMVEDTDYGKIPGTQKPTLLKPGAEKLVELFRCTPEFRLINSTEDFSTNLFAYTFRVRLRQRDIDAVVAEGFGSCNSKEGRYAYRDAQRKCPKCNAPAIFKSKNEGEGWYCWAKKGGCGAKFKPGDAAIEKQEAGKVPNEDVATLANTILKMAKKRALVDGAIALARCSDLFTQDAEDLPREEHPRQEARAEERDTTLDAEKHWKPSQQEKVDADAAEKFRQANHAHARRLWEQAKAKGMESKGYAVFVADCLGAREAPPSGQWTAGQFALIEAAIAAFKKPSMSPLVDVQPGESEEDAERRMAREHQAEHDKKHGIVRPA